MSPRKEPRRRGNGATMIALAGLLILACGLWGLVAVVMPTMILFPAIVLGIVGFGFFHYLMWGWWLSGLEPPEDDD